MTIFSLCPGVKRGYGFWLGRLLLKKILFYQQRLFSCACLRQGAGVHAKFLGVGVSVSGIFDKTTQTIRTSAISYMEGAPVKAVVEDVFGIPCYVDNESNLCAVAVHQQNSHVYDLLYMHISQGVGIGIITGGTLLSGHNGYAAEIAHFPFGTTHRRCPICGNYGCVEPELSVSGMLRNGVWQETSASDAEDRNDSYTESPVPNHTQKTSASWGVWRPSWHANWVWISTGEDSGYWEDTGWWDFNWTSYSASLTASMSITPDTKDPTASGKVLKSGYGINQTTTARVNTNQSSAVTDAQTAVTYFPEFGYQSFWRLDSGCVFLCKAGYSVFRLPETWAV